ncbi:hypothetical protein, partial [Nocardia sp. NPDC058497]|uniref:hypothetical protein n=1 Tax=Nocardia sp. NPDC058497 TaxID=3346529 RepID=UPI003663ACE1
MKLFVRLRHRGWPAALLMAALLMVPAVDCSLVREHSHSDGHHATASASTSITDANDILDVIKTAAHCDVDIVHCTTKAMPPGVLTLTLSALLLAAVTAVVCAAPTPPAPGEGFRGRPRSPPEAE